MHRYAFEQLKLRQYVKKYKIDLLHSLGYTSPFFIACPTVVTVHDLNFKAIGNTMSLSRRIALRTIVRQAVLRSKFVITVSEFSKQEILGHYRIDPDKVIVIHHAADDACSIPQTDVNNEPLKLKKPFCVAFSSATANKNILRLIRAFLEAKHCNKFRQNLVLIGHRHPAADSLPLGDQKDSIHWAGYLKKNEAIRIMRNADFLVFPSFYEGFGLPVLDAMAAGVPVVCSQTASLPEVAGDAAIYFDPFSVKDMAEKISLMATNQKLKNTLREKGYNNCIRFSWRKAATETLSVYDLVFRLK